MELLVEQSLQGGIENLFFGQVPVGGREVGVLLQSPGQCGLALGDKFPHFADACAVGEAFLGKSRVSLGGRLFVVQAAAGPHGQGRAVLQVDESISFRAEP